MGAEVRQPELRGKAAVASAAARPGARAGGQAARWGECDKPPPPPPSLRAREERGRPRAGQATDPAQRPAPGAGPAAALKRHHAGHPEDPPATDFQDRH